MATQQPPEGLRRVVRIVAILNLAYFGIEFARGSHGLRLKGDLMKTLVLLLILSVTFAASAQTTKVPATLQVSPTMIMATNASTQEIIAIIVRSPAGGSGWSGVISHDFYFKHGITPTEATAVDAHDDSRTYISAELLFVQFADGSTWGDSKLAVELLARRTPQKTFFENVLSAYQSQGSRSFVDQLQQERQFIGVAARLLDIQKQSGTQAAVDVVKERLAAANSRLF